MCFVGLTLALAIIQQSYDSLSAGERFLYHQLSKQLDAVAERVDANAVQQSQIVLRVHALEIYSETLRSETKHHRARVEELEKYREYARGRELGIAALTGVVMALVNMFGARKLRNFLDRRR